MEPEPSSDVVEPTGVTVGSTTGTRSSCSYTIGVTEDRDSTSGTAGEADRVIKTATSNRSSNDGTGFEEDRVSTLTSANHGVGQNSSTNNELVSAVTTVDGVVSTLDTSQIDGVFAFATEDIRASEGRATADVDGVIALAQTDVGLKQRASARSQGDGVSALVGSNTDVSQLNCCAGSAESDQVIAFATSNCVAVQGGAGGDGVVTSAAFYVVCLGASLGANSVITITTFGIIINPRECDGVMATKTLHQIGCEAGGIQSVVTGISGQCRRSHRRERRTDEPFLQN